LQQGLDLLAGEPAADKVVTAVTLLGVIFIPAAVLCTFLWPSYLFPLAVFSTIFQAGSVVNGRIGGFEFGLPPFYFVASCIALRFLYLVFVRGRVALRRYGPVQKLATFLALFWWWSVMSSFVMPCIYRGVPVYSPREGIDEQYLYPTPLQWSFSNLAQSAFLTLDVIVFFYALYALKTRDQSDKSVKFFYFGWLFAGAVGLSQRVAITTGWEFPYGLFNSNPVYNQGADQVLGSWGRITSTFTEPSYAGAVFAAAVAGLLAGYLRGKRSVKSLAVILGLLAVLIYTTATTGYLALGITMCLLFLYFFPMTRDERYRRNYARGWLIVAACGIGAVTLALQNPDLSEAVKSITFDKVDTLSMVHRIAADIHALTLVGSTYGLGVGLGSNRPSSLLTALVSTVGIPGTILFATCLYHIFGSAPRRSEPTSVHIAFWALVALSIAQAVSVPDITSPALWALLAMVAAQINIRYSTAPTLVKQVSPTQISHRVKPITI
jgi:hypothetical protein